MHLARSCSAVLGLSILLGAEAKAQVAYQPIVQTFPNGVILGTTPVVSHDRRYVRIGVNPQFNAFEGFDPFTVPAAVSGGGGGGVGVGAGGLGGLGGLRGGVGRNGLMAVPVNPAPKRPAAGKRIAVDSGPAPGALVARARAQVPATGKKAARKPEPIGRGR